MSLQVYSRDYLQSIPEKKKQEHIDAIVASFIYSLLNIAERGGKSFAWKRSYVPSSGILIDSSTLTDAELVAGFFTRFPGCNVYYEEAWVDSGNDTKTLNKGIVIDWS
jgi:hypothetical protein